MWQRAQFLSKWKITLKAPGSGESTSSEAFELLLPGRDRELEAGFEIPSRFPFIISIDILHQVKRIKKQVI